RQARIELDLDPDLEYVGTISSLVPYEGIETVVEAAALLMPTRPNLRLLIVGDGTALPNIIETAKKLGVADKLITPAVLIEINLTCTIRLWIFLLCRGYLLKLRAWS